MSAPSTPSKRAAGSEDKDASIEMRDFIFDVESSAKRILQRSNKKRMAEAEAKKNRERYEMTRRSSSMGGHKGHVSPGKKGGGQLGWQWPTVEVLSRR